METWSISPETGVQNPEAQDGKYIFTPPKSGEIVYTITYTDGDISGSMEYVVKSTDCYVNPCSTNLTPPTVTPPTVTNFSHEGGDIEATWNADTCWELITATTTNNATAATLTNPSIISVAANTSPTKVTSVVTYKFKNTVANVTGQSKVTIAQEINPCYEDRTPPVATGSKGHVPTLGTDDERKVKVTTSCTNNNCNCWKLDRWEFIEPTPPNRFICRKW